MVLSEQVKACQDVVRVICPLLRERAAKTGEAITAFFRPFLAPDQTPPDGAALLLLIASAIEWHQEKLEEADVAHARELGDDAEPRQNRDNEYAKLYGEMTNLRSEVEAVYGPLGIRALGMSGNTPQDPPRLERLARDVSGRLLDPDYSLGTPKNRISLDRQSAGSVILALCDALKHWIGVVDTEVAEAKTTQEARARALSEWYDKVPRLCALARGLLLVAGDEEGAGRIISTPPRYRSSSSKEEEAQAKDASAPAEAEKKSPEEEKLSSGEKSEPKPQE